MIFLHFAVYFTVDMQQAIYPQNGLGDQSLHRGLAMKHMTDLMNITDKTWQIPHNFVTVYNLFTCRMSSLVWRPS